MVREKVAKTKAPSQLYTLMQLSIFCLQNEASFGISQLLNAPILANQNKIKRRENSNFEIVGQKFLDQYKCVFM